MDLVCFAQRGAASFLALCAALAVGCTSTSTSAIAPSASKCQVTAEATPSQFTATGGSGSVRISAARDCTWTVGAQAPWVAVDGSSGNGDAVVSYTVASNPAPAARSAELVVETQRLAVTQAAAACTFSFSRSGDGIAAEGGTLDVQLTTLSGCAWNATVDAAWLSLPGARSGSASGTIRIAVAANTGGSRSGTVSAGGRTYVVSQDAAAVVAPGPAPSPSPTPVPAPSPSPSPIPAPSPQPTPAPTPVPVPITFTGTVSGLSGSCPTVSFMASGHGVVASRSTNYSRGKCGELSNGGTVTVNGILQIDGSVTAGDIEFIKNGK